MKKILTSLGMIAFAGAIVASGTGAFFSDTETSTGNIFTAGNLDLKIDSVAHINGLVCHNDGNGNRWIPEDQVVWNADEEKNELVVGADVSAAIATYNTTNPANVPEAGADCEGTWALADLNTLTSSKFFNYNDLKPGDNGENTVSIHVDYNDAYMCAAVHNVNSVDANGTSTGNLDKDLKFKVWEDDGDNIYQEGEVELTTGTLENINTVYPLYTPVNGVLEGGKTKYLGISWCFGEFNADGTCNGQSIGNDSQGDSLTVDLSFYIEQARHNEGFTCPDISTFEGEETTPVDPTPIWNDEGTRTGGSASFVGDEDRGDVLRVLTTADDDSRVRWTNNTLDIDLASFAGIEFDSMQVVAPNQPVSNVSVFLTLDLPSVPETRVIAFEPYYNIQAYNSLNDVAMTLGNWHTWKMTLANGKFWANDGFLGATPAGGAYATNFTLQQVVDNYPGAKITGISFGMGTYNPGQEILVDNLKINGASVSLEN